MLATGIQQYVLNQERMILIRMLQKSYKGACSYNIIIVMTLITIIGLTLLDLLTSYC